MGGIYSSQRSAFASAAATGGGDASPGGGVPRSGRRVLIGVDGSKGAQKAFDYWCQQPGSQDDSLILINTVEMPNVLTGLLLSPSGTFDYEEYEKHGRQLKQRSQQLQQEFMGQCEKRRLHCKFVSEVSGSPGAVIVAAVKTYSASVVVLGCRGNNGIRRTILGSVSDYVLQHSCRPVIVVPDVAAS